MSVSLWLSCSPLFHSYSLDWNTKKKHNDFNRIKTHCKRKKENICTQTQKKSAQYRAQVRVCVRILCKLGAFLYFRAPFFVIFFSLRSSLYQRAHTHTRTQTLSHTWWDDESCGNKCLWIVNKSRFKLFYIEKLEFHQFSVRAFFSVDDGVYARVKYSAYSAERMIERTSVQTNRRSLFLVGISVYGGCPFFLCLRFVGCFIWTKEKMNSS